jgi:hypothetical protein
MKSNRNFSLIVILVFASIMMSCGPVIISSRPQHPTPSWF